MMHVVEVVKAGRITPHSRAQVDALLVGMREQGAATTVVGCTKISALLGELQAAEDLDALDPALKLAFRTIKRAT